MIRVVLPAHLKNLAHVSGEVRLEVGRRRSPSGWCWTPSRRSTRCCSARSATASSGKRRAFVRFYACEEDLSNESPDTPLPDRVVAGEEPFIILGAMAGG